MLQNSRLIKAKAASHFQVFKFGCYLSIPVLMTVFVAGNPGRLEAIIKNVSHLNLGLLSPLEENRCIAPIH